MSVSKLRIFHLSCFLACLFDSMGSSAQDTQIKGFVAANMMLQDDKLDFGIGEQDLFITSDLNDNFTFLGETVFTYSPNSPTKFNVSVERIIIKYNYKSNHNILIGKHHTPTHYWNDTYHHGRVFYPTVERPLMFAAYTFPIHTAGLGFTGLNLGKLRFGYNVLIGNGIGSGEISDNDKYKSVTAAVYVKPKDKLQLGVSYYSDVISEGAEDHHGNVFLEKINQHLYTATIANFGQKFEFLAEGTFATNHAESTGTVNSFSSYIYTGWRVKEKWVPYVRFDYLKYNDGEIFYEKDDTTSIIVGMRLEVSFLVVVKMEYQHMDSELSGISDLLNTQIAIGF